MKRFVGCWILFFIVFLFVSFIKHSECLSSSGVIILPKTGQTTCYKLDGASWTQDINCSIAGQDGELQKGAAWPSPRFVVYGDCVTDNLTGLMWAKNGNIYDGTVNWEGALNYVKTDIGSLCGYNDWRLPNINELKSLLHRAKDDTSEWLKSPTGVFNSVQSGYYWSSTTYVYFDSQSETFKYDKAWRVNMSDGSVDGDNKDNSNYVFPVSGGQSDNADPSYPANIPKTGQTTKVADGDDGDLKKGVAWPEERFTVGSDDEGDCITDNLTGLM